MPPLLSPIRATYPAHPILIKSLWLYLVKGTDRKLPHYPFLSTPLLPKQISSSAPYPHSLRSSLSETPSFRPV
jgi:hypothetical protein